MAENVGGIQYTVDADTSGIIKAQTQVDKSINSMAGEFKALDKTVSTSSRRINTEMNKAASGVKRGVQANLGQAGIQVQQFVGQLQGGQSAMVALAQQSADLGIVLGAPMVGVIVSLAAVLAGTLLPALFNSKSGMEELEKSIERTRAIMTIGAGGVVEYTEKMQELGRISKIVADYRIKTAMNDAKNAITNGVKAIGEEFSKLNDGDIMTNFNDAVRFSDQLYGQFSGRIGQYAKFIGTQLGATGEESKKLGAEFIQAFKRLEGAKTVQEVTSIQESIIKLAESTGKADKKITDALGNVFEQFDLIREGATVLEQAAKGQDDLSNTTAKSSTAAADLANSLTAQIVALKEGERAAFAYGLQLQGMSEAKKEVLLNLYDQKKALEDEKSLHDANSQSLEQEIDGYIRLADSIETARITKERQAAAQEERRIQTLETNVQSIGLDPEEEIRARFERENQMLIEAEERGIEIRGTYAERRKQLALEEQQAIDGLQKSGIFDLSKTMEMAQTQAAGLFAQFAIGSVEGEDAIKQLARTVITQMIGMAAQSLISNAMAAATGTATAATLATAYAPAAALSSLATVGTNSVPAIAAIGTTLAVAAAGAREFGGPVTAGKSYLVGERGPEMFTPGSSGGITSNKDMMVGGQAWNINVNNNGPEKAYVTIDEVSRAVNIQIGKMVKGVRNNSGAMGKAINQTTSSRSRATAR